MSLLAAMNRQFAIPVIREQDAAILESLCLALAEGGLNLLEITLMSDAALTVMRRLSKSSDLIIGAGTVLNSEQAKQATDAGAKFLVSPGLDENSVRYAQENKISFFPGVLTPSEIMRAQSLNCEMVKVFPASAVGGPGYIKALKGPFPEMKWMATGGISLHDLKVYLNLGVTCVGLGTQLTPVESVKAKDWNAIRQLAMEHVAEIKLGRSL